MMSWLLRARTPVAEDPSVAEEVRRFGQEVRESNQRRLAALVEAERRQLEVRAEADRKRTEEVEARRQKAREGAERIQAQWLETRKALQAHLENARGALAQVSVAERDLSSVESAVQTANTVALVLAAERLVADAEQAFQRHEAGRPRV